MRTVCVVLLLAVGACVDVVDAEPHHDDGDDRNDVATCGPVLAAQDACRVPISGPVALTLEVTTSLQVVVSTTAADAGLAGTITLEDGPAIAMASTDTGVEAALWPQQPARATLELRSSSPVDVVVSTRAVALTPEVVCTEGCGALRLFPVPSARDSWRLVSPLRYAYGRREIVEAALRGVLAVERAFPGTGPVAIADLSQRDLEIPGTDDGVLRHPAPAHAGGFAIDVGYYRKDGRHDVDEAACPSSTREYCEGPHVVDLARTVTAMLGIAAEPGLVQLIVDPVMEQDVRDELDRLSSGDDVDVDVDPDALARLRAVLISGPPFHADHFHATVARQCYDRDDNDGDGLFDLDDPDCTDAVDDDEGR